MHAEGCGNIGPVKVFTSKTGIPSYARAQRRNQLARARLCSPPQRLGSNTTRCFPLDNSAHAIDFNLLRGLTGSITRDT